MAVMVTGLGYIGSLLVQRLLQRGDRVVAIENFFSTDRPAVGRLAAHPGFALIEGDVTDEAVLRQAFSVDRITVVHHLAAQSSAHPMAAPARYTEETNLIGPRVLLDAMVEHGVPRIVFASSFKVYDRELPAIVTEATPYGRFSDLSHLSKVYVEKLLELYALQAGLTCLSARIGIVYGLSPVMKRDYRFMTAPNKFSLQVVKGEQIEVHAGTERPAGFIHIADAADAMIEAADASFSGYVPFNAVTEMLTVGEVADAVAAAASARGLCPSLSRPERNSATVVPEPVVQSALAEFFGRPRQPLRSSVGEMIDFFRAEHA